MLIERIYGVHPAARSTTLELQASLEMKSSVFLWYADLITTMTLVEVAIWPVVFKVSQGEGLTAALARLQFAITAMCLQV
jgi:hypothetical protein